MLRFAQTLSLVTPYLLHLNSMSMSLIKFENTLSHGGNYLFTLAALFHFSS